ncbi:hypothetical protein PINS_up002433 [Pythium insidiosum]|nr:hypothetical protein PINS_up002433 [Pythium insidiosum]
MGNKHGKPRGSSGPISGSSKGNTAAAPPAAPTAAAAPSSSGAARPIRINPILESKLSSLDVTAVFSPQEIQAIRVHLSSLLGVHESEPIVIRKEEFYRFLGTSTSSLYVNRLYAIFDMAGKGTVDFDDLMRGLAILSQKASREQKLLLSFHLLDADGTGYITKQTTTDLLRSCLAECKEVDICLSDAQIAKIVETTFEEADLDRNNVVDLKEYQALDDKHPGLFDFLTVDAIGVLHHLEKVQSMHVSAE